MHPTSKAPSGSDKTIEQPLWTGDFSLRHFQLPTSLVASLSEHRSSCEEQMELQRIQEANARIAVAKKVADKKPRSEPLAWKQKFDPKSKALPLVKILSRQDVEALYAAENEGSRSCEPGDKLRAEALCRTLAAKGEYRRLGQLPVSWQAELSSLEEQFPNFCEVIHYLRAMFNLALSAPIESPNFAVASFDPILIDGPPGVGKSFFCQSIAELLGVPFRRHDLGSMQTSGELVGSDAMWSNAKMGGVFKVLTESDFANPVLLLDELDKTQNDHRYNPDTALLALLERSTSTSFHDQSIPDVTIDASRIYWIATSNDKSCIPAPLLSRFRTFDVGPIPKEHAQSFVLKVLSNVAEEMHVECDRELQTDVIERASSLSPRALQSVLREALAYALLNRRTKIAEEDLTVAIQARQSRLAARIGF